MKKVFLKWTRNCLINVVLRQERVLLKIQNNVTSFDPLQMLTTAFKICIYNIIYFFVYTLKMSPTPLTPSYFFSSG